MSAIAVYWEHPAFDQESGTTAEPDAAGPDAELRAVRQGMLTTDHPEAIGQRPVLVEQETKRVYSSADLPPSTVVFIEGKPDAVELVEAAREAGFDVRSAEE